MEMCLCGPGTECSVLDLDCLLKTQVLKAWSLACGATGRW
jgi:hypothetical protein